MARILFVANSLPFPPRDGNELPSARILDHLAERFEVDLLVVGGRDPVGSPREANLPRSVNLFFAEPNRRSLVHRVLHELAGTHPGYFDTSFTGEDLDRHLPTWNYDLAWVSPVSCLGFIRYARRRGHAVAKRVAVGLNDVTTGLYAETFAASVSGRERFSAHRLVRGLRLPSVRRHERRYLGDVDLVHLQTPVERDRINALFGSRRMPRVVVAPNGKKEELAHVRYAGEMSKRVLFMTHLDGQRAVESRWFLRRVWPKVIQSVPDAELWLAGTPPDVGGSSRADWSRTGVRVLGYVDDLAALYGQIAVAVVPIYHGTGLINRVQDAITAGVPSLSTSMALATIDGLVPGVHALSADDADDFAYKLACALGDPQLLHSIADQAKTLSSRLPSWGDSLHDITTAIQDVL